MIAVFKTFIASIICFECSMVLFDYLNPNNDYIFTQIFFIFFNGFITVGYMLFVLLPIYSIQKKKIDALTHKEAMNAFLPFVSFATAIISILLLFPLSQGNQLDKFYLIMVINIFCIAYLGLYNFLKS